MKRKTRKTVLENMSLFGSYYFLIFGGNSFHSTANTFHCALLRSVESHQCQALSAKQTKCTDQHNMLNNSWSPSAECNE